MLQTLKDYPELEAIPASTAHQFQGDEKSLMIIDITNSNSTLNKEEAYQLGYFLEKTEKLEEDGSRLYNVAISRAKHHLVFVLNSQFLDFHLSKNSIVRGILHEAEKRPNGLMHRRSCVTRLSEQQTSNCSAIYWKKLNTKRSLPLINFQKRLRKILIR